MTTESNHHPGAAATAWVSLVVGLLSFLPVPGPVRGAVAVALGFMSRRTADGRLSEPARAGIMLGVLSLTLFVALGIVYFGILGYPLPRIAPYQRS